MKIFQFLHTSELLSAIACLVKQKGRLPVAICLIALLMAGHSNQATAAAKTIAILSHYKYPPYVTTPDNGLTFDLAMYLTKKSYGRYIFQVEILPKRRLLSVLNQTDKAVVVPWVLPEWMREARSHDISWSDTVMESDDLVVSSLRHPVEGKASFNGLRFGGILGHVYTDLESAIAKGELVRDDAPDDESNLRKLRKQRIDFLFLPDHTLQYYRYKNPVLLEDLYISKSKRNDKPHALKLMLKVPDENDKSALKSIIANMQQDAEWHTILRRYGMDASP